MNILWIIDELKTCKAISVPHTNKVQIYSILDAVERAFNIPPEYQVFYNNGKKVYEIMLDNLSENNPIGLINLSNEPCIILDFRIGDSEESLKIAIGSHQDKTLFDALLILVKTYDLSQLLERVFSLYTDTNDLLDFTTELAELLSTVIHIHPVQSATVNIQVELNETCATLQCSGDMLGKDLRYHIALM